MSEGGVRKHADGLRSTAVWREAPRPQLLVTSWGALSGARHQGHNYWRPPEAHCLARGTKAKTTEARHRRTDWHSAPEQELLKAEALSGAALQPLPDVPSESLFN
uniref:Uncharacterized protein n=1 Tax=Solanum tuberosum TaxID=4113 RepID=M1DU06_SOLTU